MTELDYFQQIPLSLNRCFVCGNELTKENSTREHIYPKWLQNKFNLWDQSLILLNSTEIKYKDLVVPCCKACNRCMSACIEKPMQQHVEGGYDLFINCNKTIVFQWLNKIAYGTLFKEMTLKNNRSNPNSETIYPPQYLQEHIMQHRFLSSTVNNTRFLNQPYSLLIFRVKNNGPRYNMWDYPMLHTICMQINDIGIISCLMDNGLTEKMFMLYEDVNVLLRHPLHPIQFAEICAKFIYKVSLFYRTPSYSSIFDAHGNPQVIISHELCGPAFYPWVHAEYAYVFCKLLTSLHYNYSVADLYNGDDLARTFIHDQEGNFMDIPL